tara:strand:+ start:173 stop:646 length:474 start_codon:yes stop_codon:yes gene_type:complete
MKYDSDNLWSCGDKKLTTKQVFESIKEYVNIEGIIYVGTDSMLKNDSCKFVSVIAIHSNKMKVANYFFKKISLPPNKYKALQNKIFEEVDCSLEIAKELSEFFPRAKIEVHVDVGKTNRSKTKIYVDTIRGWVTGLGFLFKIKPKSWASYIADWHSK